MWISNTFFKVAEHVCRTDTIFMLIGVLVEDFFSENLNFFSLLYLHFGRRQVGRVRSLIFYISYVFLQYSFKVSGGNCF